MRPLPASSAIQWQALLHQCPPDLGFWRSRMVQWTEMVQSGDLLAAAQVVYEVVDRSSESSTLTDFQAAWYFLGNAA